MKKKQINKGDLMVAEERPEKLGFLGDFEETGELKPLPSDRTVEVENSSEPENPKDTEHENQNNAEDENQKGGLPRGTIKRLMKDLTDLNVSQSAVEQMAEILEGEIKSIMVIAVHESKKENMKTIKGRHVKKSYNLILKEILAKVVKSTKKTEYIIKELVTNLILDIPEDTPIELKEGKDE